MHPNCLLALEHAHAMAHHTRLVQGRLTVENDDVAVGEMAVDLAVDLGGTGVGEADVGAVEAGGGRAGFRSEELVRMRGSLLFRQSVLNYVASQRRAGKGSWKNALG